MDNTLSLFDEPAVPTTEILAPGAVLLRGFALRDEAALLAAIEGVAKQAPFRHMVVPGGHRMSAQLTNCGDLGWVTDETGYRYTARDPQSGQPWPVLPDCFRQLAGDAAQAAGFDDFVPDACLINRYAPKARMGLHQDKNERDFGQPIVSVSLGVTATFLFGGLRRADITLKIPLVHGDVVVWGGPARMRYHGIAPLKEGRHPQLGEARINLTLRKAS